MALISASSLSLTFSGPPLLDNSSLQIHEGERICLLGRNGEGKSTLMRILAGDFRPESGEVRWAKDLTMASLPQEVPGNLTGTVSHVVSSGAGRSDVAWRPCATKGPICVLTSIWWPGPMACSMIRPPGI